MHKHKAETIENSLPLPFESPTVWLLLLLRPK